MADIFTEAGLPEEVALFYVSFMSTAIVIALGFSLITYIFQGIGMYTIAKRRGIEKPWLAWVPVGNTWLLGCISDQFRYLAYGETTNRRSQLLRRNIFLQVVSMALSFGLIFATVLFADHVISEDGYVSVVLLMVLGVYGLLALTVVTMILQYRCLFDLYRSCNPSMAVVFLLLSILVAYPQPFLLYACRNKDLGMPPRHTNPPQYRPELPNYGEY